MLSVGYALGVHLSNPIPFVCGRCKLLPMAEAQPKLTGSTTAGHHSSSETQEASNLDLLGDWDLGFRLRVGSWGFRGLGLGV